MAASAIDPAFNGGQPYLLEGGRGGTTQNSASAVAVNSAGDIIVAGSILDYDGLNTLGSTGLAVRAFSSVGTPLANFGANGQATVALPAGAYNRVAAASDVLIQPDGRIIVAAILSQADQSAINPRVYISTPVETVVARLNADGTPDTSFGTNGSTVISAGTAQLSQLSLQADGKILLGGTIGAGGGVAGALTRLDADGSIDPSFNGGNVLNNFGQLTGIADLATNAAGQVYVTLIQGGRFLVERLNPDGAVDASFGNAGVVDTTLESGSVATVVQADGRLVVAGGSQSDEFQLRRLDADGSFDPTFLIPTLPLLPVTSIAVQGDGKFVVGLNGLGAARYNRDGTPDGTFGPGAVASFYVAPPASAKTAYVTNPTASGVSDGVAILPDGRVALVGTATYYGYAPGSFGGYYFQTSELIVAALRRRVATPGDYDGDNKADVAAQLATLGYFAVRKSTGGDVLFPFGATTIGKTIPAEADYDGDGRTDVAAYLPDLGTLVYASSAAGNAQVSVRFGSAGDGASIPAVGDYDGDGKADVAVYLPASGAFAIRPSNGAGNELAPFGTPGLGRSIPAPGDYDGDGRADLAVYLPALGALAYRPSRGGPDVFVAFGPSGDGASIPVTGDYDGDGRTDVAVYLPQLARLAVRPSTLGPNYSVPFGIPGAGLTVPAPGDYDGDGRTDVAAYLPTLAILAYRPSTGGPDVYESFGAPGAGATVPSTSIPYAQPPGVSAAALAGSGGSARVWLPLTDDLLPGGTGRPKKSRA